MCIRDRRGTTLHEGAQIRGFGCAFCRARELCCVRCRALCIGDDKGLARSEGWQLEDHARALSDELRAFGCLWHRDYDNLVGLFCVTRYGCDAAVDLRYAAILSLSLIHISE